MRKFIITAALATATIAAAVPASAQWAPQGNAYGYDNRGQGRRLEVRIMQLRREIAQLDRRNIISEREARRLDAEARSLEMQFRQMSYNGIDGRERYVLVQRIERLEQNIRRQATDGNRRGNDNRYGDRYDSNGYDRDRDGRDDRYEDDRGRYPG
jgi:predicted RNase H-like nuclease (RuvC/YqgF family)